MIAVAYRCVQATAKRYSPAGAAVQAAGVFAAPLDPELDGFDLGLALADEYDQALNDIEEEVEIEVSSSMCHQQV